MNTSQSSIEIAPWRLSLFEMPPPTAFVTRQCPFILFHPFRQPIDCSRCISQVVSRDLSHSFIALMDQEVDLITASDEEIAETIPYWSSALTSWDLLNGVHPNAYFNKLSAKPYYPNCFAQQFGLIQGIPTPYPSMVASDTRPLLLLLEKMQLVTTNNKLDQFQFKPFVVNPRTVSAYAYCWISVSNRAFPLDLDKYLSKLISGSQSRFSQPPRPTTTKALP